jgi:hypothetical protein
VDYQDVLDQYAAEYLAAQQYLEEQYRSELAIYEQQLADYQAQLDREYSSIKISWSRSMQTPSRSMTNRAPNTRRQFPTTSRHRKVSNSNTMSELDDYKRQIDEAAALRRKSTRMRLQNTSGRWRNLHHSLPEPGLSGQSLLSGSVGRTTTWDTGTVTGGFDLRAVPDPGDIRC